MASHFLTPWEFAPRRLNTNDGTTRIKPLGRVAHFLDLPLFIVIVYCGAVRPYSWTYVLGATAVAVVVAIILTNVLPRLVRHSAIG